MRYKSLLRTCAALLLAAPLVATLAAAPAQATLLRVTVTNTSPAGGVGLSPVWVGFHDGSFDLYNRGEAASSGIEGVAEDGDTTAITGIFAATANAGGVQGTLPGGPAFPGQVRTEHFHVDTQGAGRFFSYLSMVVVSNDFFIANGNPQAIDLSGLQVGETLSFLAGVPFADGVQNLVLDAGTEVEDFQFSLANGAFGIPGGQTGPNQGADQNGVITAVEGDPFANFLNAPVGFTSGPLNFNNPNLYSSIALIEVTAVPEPASMALLLTGVVALGATAWRRREGGAAQA